MDKPYILPGEPGTKLFAFGRAGHHQRRKRSPSKGRCHPPALRPGGVQVESQKHERHHADKPKSPSCSGGDSRFRQGHADIFFPPHGRNGQGGVSRRARRLRPRTRDTQKAPTIPFGSMPPPSRHHFYELPEALSDKYIMSPHKIPKGVLNAERVHPPHDGCMKKHY